METLENAVFGKMSYDFQWEKKDNVVLFGTNITVTTVVEALPGESISKIQEDNYKKVKETDSLITDKHLGKIIDYLNKTYKKTFTNSLEILNYVKLQTLLFKQNGKVVLLFLLPNDDLGMGIEIIPNFSIGVQDLYI